MLRAFLYSACWKVRSATASRPLIFFMPLHVILDALWKYCFAWAISPYNQEETELSHALQFVAVQENN